MSNSHMHQSLDEVVTLPVSPRNRETSPGQLRPLLTPSGAHFVRSNFDLPELAGAWTLQIGGAVRAPLTLDLDALLAFSLRSQTVTMECAGNGRLGMRPLPRGEPWSLGAVSTAEWTGVPLVRVLEKAGLRDDVVELLFESADGGFARSLPREKATSEEVLLAVQMNGAPLTPEHGAPLRLIVPGWYGMASVKWLRRIEAITAPFRGHFQSERYVLIDEAGRVAAPVQRVRVRALITSPLEGDRVPRGRVDASGWAWTGEGEISGVEVAVGGGEDWTPAELLDSAGRWAWTRWRAVVSFEEPGRAVLRARAHDSGGLVQPDEADWNRLGYCNNSIAPVVLEVI
ncbi:MAG: sulfite oxidase [Myxococcaceae bacterium]